MITPFPLPKTFYLKNGNICPEHIEWNSPVKLFENGVIFMEDIQLQIQLFN